MDLCAARVLGNESAAKDQISFGTRMLAELAVFSFLPFGFLFSVSPVSVLLPASPFSLSLTFQSLS